MTETLFTHAARHAGSIALIEGDGTSCTYKDLLSESQSLAERLRAGGCLPGERVAFLAAPGRRYVVALWAIWRLHAIAVPLAGSHSQQELRHVLGCSRPRLVLAEKNALPALGHLAAEAHSLLIDLSQHLPADFEGSHAEAYPDSETAIILFTSGTTSKPKGVMITHGNLRAQMEMLCEAWAWTGNDRILHCLPLHHVHGIVNALLCPLWMGASVAFLPKFDAETVWLRLQDPAFTVFMGVPTMYARLLAHMDTAEEKLRTACAARIRSMRLWVSGSAALPVALQTRWLHLSGRYLLERYGMTEIGMALGIPYHTDGKPGFVGIPFTSVLVRLVDEDFQDVAAGTPGEILIKGPSVFKGYWENEAATASAFHDGWFVTGDVAVQDEAGDYRIMGRRSTDILKSGGYKLSALEIEEVFRQHPDVLDCAVVGLEDEAWGEIVALAIEGRATVDEVELLGWARTHLAHYKLPRRVIWLDALPRNAMGKVVKAEVKKLLSAG